MDNSNNGTLDNIIIEAFEFYRHRFIGQRMLENVRSFY